MVHNFFNKLLEIYIESRVGVRAHNHLYDASNHDIGDHRSPDIEISRSTYRGIFD